MDISGYILAGGKGSRIGGSKHDVVLNGIRLIEHALAILKPVCVEVAVISKEPLVANARNILDHSPDGGPSEGPLVGLYSAFLDAATEWSVALACDMPFVTSELVELLVSFAADEFDAVIPVQPDGQPQPLCAVYRTDICLNAASEVLDSGKRSPLAMADTVRTRYVPFADMRHLRNAERFFLNLNTPADLATAEDIFKTKKALDSK
ncbi:MAG: molybdenum cofactor guanylyltransferase [Pyrinomonadaceae bacterium]|nr:molybdenum cofactor guanylyltransferase [Pyrinomonadaceae bacterium]